MKSVFRLLFLLAAVPGLFLLAGCEDAEEEVATEEIEDWDPEWGPAPGSSETATGAEGEEVVRDTAYIVVEKRQAGGHLVPDGTEVSKFDGRPRMKRVPLETMIIVEGNQTAQRAAYLLPQGDFNVVQVGHRLQESTLARWESTTENHIPPPPEEPEESGTHRSRTGGAAENYVY